MDLNDKIKRLSASLPREVGTGGKHEAAHLPGAAEAMLLCSLQRISERPILWIAPDQDALIRNHRDLLSLLQECGEPADTLYYPAWESLPRDGLTADPDIIGHRLRAIRHLSESQTPTIVATCIQALLQMSLSPKALKKHTWSLCAGDDVDMKSFIASLTASHYDFQAAATTKCQAFVRGGLVDLWPPTEDLPLRLEFYDGTLESIRTYDPIGQRSLRRMESALICPASEWSLMTERRSHAASLSAYIPSDSTVVWSDFPGIEQSASTYESIVRETNHTDIAQSLNSLRRRLKKTSASLLIGDTTTSQRRSGSLGFTPIDGVSSLSRDMMEPDLTERNRHEFLERLVARSKDGQHVYLFFSTAGALERYRETHPAHNSLERFHPTVGRLSEGFINEALGLAVASEDDIYGKRKSLHCHSGATTRRSQPASPSSVPIASFSDLEPGDPVVHVQHGIGRYVGLSELTFDDQPQEVLTIEYADSARLHVPVSQAHLLSRYIGVGDRKIVLHQLGHKRWQRETTAATLAVKDFAAYLLETQAARETLKGFAYGPDTIWQHEFEASFPYQETPDQERTTKEVKASMESTTPMDRLICGDVGFGKTEVAIRAAFKAVMAGRQVAVLVPTTVLCQQHFHTFTDRMAAYPVRIEMLSRFCPAGKRTAILKDLQDGVIDVVIGTHSLLQPRVRFRDLGLVIIDEEQRFGVNHKETLKQMRRLVDVLTLTATPIPRTLYMSLAGMKDLSTIQTPPQRRLPIQTIVSANTDAVIRSAILQEIGRQGQVYYLHNRVMTIDRVKRRLSRIIPEARITVAHGQMRPSELASVMQSFVQREYDVLLCTTIIESGLDIPNVNTIIIDRADRFGMADLYQLRGRVGRSTRRAYAYFLLPALTRIDPVARKRIATLKKYSELGSGFRLALRDLELRGAGNLLGVQQSGHVVAIGFLLYCQLLKRTIDALRGNPSAPVVDVSLRLDFIDLSPDNSDLDNSAVIPIEYIPIESQRINAYRKIAEAGSPDAVAAIQDELIDRYGRLPPATKRLLSLAQLRTAAAVQAISAIETRDDKILITRESDYVTIDKRLPRLTASSADEKIGQVLHLVEHI